MNILNRAIGKSNFDYTEPYDFMVDKDKTPEEKNIVSQRPI